jgi:hypothetical protein
VGDLIVAAHQPLFIPWLGYFDKISQVDIFVIVDNVQFTSSGWIRRNAIRGKEGPQHLVVPITQKKHFLGQLINEVEIYKNDFKWKRNHLNSYQMNYGRSPFFSEINSILKEIYSDSYETLCSLNIRLIKEVCNYLKIKTPMILASELKVDGHKTDLIINICKATKADSFMLGMGGSRDYADRNLIESNNIKIVEQNFIHPTYTQMWDPFVSNLSILDLMFNAGQESKNLFIKR